MAAFEQLKTMKIFHKFSHLFIFLLLSSASYLLSACNQVNPYGHFERVGDLNIARAGHTATLLRDGRVLIAGGESTCFADLRGQPLSDKNIGCNGPLKSLEIYDPKSRKFSLAGNLHEAHEMSNAPLLPDGRVVFIGAPGEHAEIYDPKTGQVTLSGKIRIPRKHHTLMLMKDGNILVAGGEPPRLQGSVILYDQATNSVEIFNSKTEKFTFTGKLNRNRARGQANLLPNGDVLVVHGDSCIKRMIHKTEIHQQTMEIYHPKTNSFTLSDNLLQCRFDGRLLLLNNHTALDFEGSAPLFQPISSEFLDFNKMIIQASPNLKVARIRPSVVRLNKNFILIPGGVINSFGTNSFSKEVNLCNISIDRYIKLTDLSERRLDATATQLLNGNVLVTGGQAVSIYHKSAELFVFNKEQFNG